MIYSMTGFGKAEGQVSDKKITIQLKSLNSKQFDLIAKLPNGFKEKEIDFRKKISASLERGKIELLLNYESIGKNDYRINEKVFTGYYQQLKSLSKKLNEDTDELVAAVSRFPEVIESIEEDLSEEAWNKIDKILEDAIDQLIDFRRTEGKSLEKDLCGRINAILSLLDKIPSYERERIDIVKERLLKNLEDAGQKDNYNKERFEQELVYYLEKFDISEEKVRLASHCEYFLQCLKNEKSQGKKLGFISQEIGREINTLGSKSNHLEMQKLVVQMKDELEKIKEQVLNVC